MNIRKSKLGKLFILFSLMALMGFSAIPKSDLNPVGFNKVEAAKKCSHKKTKTTYIKGKNSHTIVKTCTGCGKVVSKTGAKHNNKVTYKNVSKDHHQKYYTCKSCGYGYTANERIPHRFVYNRNNKTYKCTDCGKKK